tara:strand:- start:1212 stop:1784 length:573 start_codon:yes stop_codon:yes gene_type:complete
MTVYNNKKGYTLIELIIVLTLIGILAPGMSMIFNNILDNYRTMTEIASATKRSEYVLNRITEDINNCNTITRADDKEIEIEIANDPVQTYRYRINDSDAMVELCLADCGDDENYHTVIIGVASTTKFKYLDANLDELENDPEKPWLSSEVGDYDKLNEIIYVELKLDLVFRDSTTSYSTVVYPERKETLD